MMYSTSSFERRKLTGTKMRPFPLTPQKQLSSLDALCETMATRPPTGTPSRSSPAPMASASSERRRKLVEPRLGAGCSGSSMNATRSG